MLKDYLLEKAHTPFDWGRHDCLTFVAGAVAAQGASPIPREWVTSYSTPRGALRRYKRLREASKHKGIVEALDELYEPVLTLHPQDGSIVAREADGPLGYCFGVAYHNSVLFVGDRGIEAHQLELDDLIWQVR